MKTLVVGANGATGRLLVEQLLNRGAQVTAIVRSADSFSLACSDHENLVVVQANLLELTHSELCEYVAGCDAIASCLGHNLSLAGIFSQPHRLVLEATQRLCEAVRASDPQQAVRFVLMNTTGNANRDIPERIPFAERCVTALIRILVPPHIDNEKAADYLRTQIGSSDSQIEWVTVRPDSLIDEHAVTEYEIHPSPTRSAIFDAGKTSRVNVGHFMAELISDNQAWEKWQGQMPVIYNKEAATLS